MQYNGKDLVEMLPEKWDGKSRKMLVWRNDNDITPKERMVCGYDPIHSGWLAAETLVVWSHCADIPKAEPNQVQNIDEMIKILNAYKKGKTIEHRFRNRDIGDTWGCIDMQKPEWNWCIFEYRVKPEPAATANEEINTKIKSRRKPRRMTNRELADLLATGNVEKCYQYYVDGHDLSKVYRSHSYYRNKEDSPCAKSILIRYHGTNEWVKPLIEE